MVYVFGFIGLLAGFAAGQVFIYYQLRGRSREDLLNDRSLRWTYGVFNWIIAAVGVYCFVFMYNQYFIHYFR